MVEFLKMLFSGKHFIPQISAEKTFWNEGRQIAYEKVPKMWKLVLSTMLAFGLVVMWAFAIFATTAVWRYKFFGLGGLGELAAKSVLVLLDLFNAARSVSLLVRSFRFMYWRDKPTLEIGEIWSYSGHDNRETAGEMLEFCKKRDIRVALYERDGIVRAYFRNAGDAVLVRMSI
jgi:hypothetical protein